MSEYRWTEVICPRCGQVATVTEKNLLPDPHERWTLQPGGFDCSSGTVHLAVTGDEVTAALDQARQQPPV